MMHSRGGEWTDYPVIRCSPDARGMMLVISGDLGDALHNMHMMGHPEGVYLGAQYAPLPLPGDHYEGVM